MKIPNIVKAVAVALAVCLSGCTTTPQTSQVPDFLQQALAREATLTGIYAVAAEDESIACVLGLVGTFQMLAIDRVIVE